ncbi:hypothetical protein BD779DRAFT_1680340 [Infundibulicybe gibba]|nr:hypothetical protein BD779DRAFT_1680340 [Infundibulicybe gibba]
MSDSFADLWNSTAPPTTKPAAKQTNNLGAPLSAQPRRAPQKQDVFALLSASGSGSSTPSTRSRPITPLLQPTSTGGAKPKTTSAGGDAFSSLFSGTPLNGAGRGRNMTIAERAAKVEEERRARYVQSQQRAKPVESARAWDGLDTLGGGGRGAVGKPSVAVEDEWGLGLGAAASASKGPNEGR